VASPLDKIAEYARASAAAAERIATDPHAEDILAAGLGVMPFDAVRLSGAEPAGRRKPATRRRAIAHR
jgi:hypothetical protein